MKKVKREDSSNDRSISDDVDFVAQVRNHCIENSKIAQIFQIDHILEEILTTVDFFTLKNCRLVQRNWAHCGAKEIKKRAKINLYFSNRLIGENVFKMRPQRSTISGRHRRSTSKIPEDNKYSELMALMKSASKFPCNFIQVHTKHLMSSAVQTFFSSVGQHVTRLTLSVQYHTMEYSSHTAGSDVMDSVKLLLTQQMPNLVYLKINYCHRFDNPVCTNEMRAWNSDPTKHIIDLDDCSQSKRQLLKLKIFIVDSVFPERGIREILEASPHLNSFSVQSRFFYHEIKPILENFITGSYRFRINILNGISFHPDDISIPIWERLLEKHLENLKLTEFGYWCFTDEVLCTLQNFVARVARIITEVLWSNSDTLKNLTISQLHILQKEELPIMSKLEKLKFCFCGETFLNNEKESYFPFGFRMAETFPALKIIDAGDCELSKIYRGFNILEPVLSVQRIVLQKKPYYCRIPDYVRQNVASLFPNSVLVEKETWD